MKHLGDVATDHERAGFTPCCFLGAVAVADLAMIERRCQQANVVFVRPSRLPGLGDLSGQ